MTQRCGQQVERFDGPLIHAWFKMLEQFLPAAYSVFCTKQRAYWLFHEQKDLTPPTDYKLTTLCEYFDVQLRDHEAHDALNDVRATLGIYRAMIASSAHRNAQSALVA